MTTFFNFDESNQTSVEQINTTEPIKSVETDDKGNPINTTKIETPIANETFVFGSQVNSEEPKSTNTNNTPSSNLDVKSLFTDLKDDLPEGFLDNAEITPESIKDAFSNYGDKSIDLFIQQAITDNPIMGNILSYIKNGGDVSNLSKAVVESVVISTMPFNTADDKKAVLQAAYLKEGKTKDEAELFIKSIEDNGKLDDVSNAVRNRSIAAENSAIEKLANDQKLAEAAKKSQKIKEAELINNTINSVTPDTLSGITITDKKGLASYLTVSKYKDTNNIEYTEFAVDLNKALADPIKKVLLGQLLKSNFDFSSINLKAKENIINGVNETSKNNVVIPVSNTKTTSSLDDFYNFIN